MRLRQYALASGVGIAALAVPAGALAAHAHSPQHNHGLTIVALPNRIVAGEGVTIEGQLNGSGSANQQIDLYHRVAGNPGFTLIGKTTTNSEGVYQFTRAEGIVNTNRSWYVTAPGLAGHVHSKTIKEHVAAEVSLSASTTSTDTKTPIVFSGAVSPNQVGKKVVLQVESGPDGTHWRTLASAKLMHGSTYSISYRFRTAGDRDVRVLFAGDARDDAAASDPVTVSVQQAQVAGFSIASSAKTITYGGSGATISGVLDEAGSTTPDAGVSVTLWARSGSGKWKTVGTPTTTGNDGSYSFSVNPSVNTSYEARTTFTPRRSSAPLFLGVHDAITMTPSVTSAVTGTKVTFSGNVSPDKAGSAIYLERMGADGHWQIIATKKVTHASTYAFNWRVERAGSLQFRVRVPSDSHTLGVASQAATITVTAPSSAS
jgi:hypothetical protein